MNDVSISPLTKEWEKYKRAMFVDDMPPEVLGRIRHAFMTGAASYNNIMKDICAASTNQTDLNIGMNRMYEEIKATL